jgi:hypothetical protein
MSVGSSANKTRGDLVHSELRHLYLDLDNDFDLPADCVTLFLFILRVMMSARSSDLVIAQL